MGDAKLDPRRVPRFDAIKARDDLPQAIVGWLTKLEEWSEAAVEALGACDRKIEEQQGQIEAFERADAENAAFEEKYNAIVDKIEDYARGIVTPDELIASVA